MENTSAKTTEQLLLEEQQKTNKLLEEQIKNNELMKDIEKEKSLKMTRFVIGCVGLIIAYILNRIANG